MLYIQSQAKYLNLGPKGKMSKRVEKTGTMIPPEKMFIKYWDIKPFESTSRWIRNCKMFGYYKIIQDRSCLNQAYRMLHTSNSVLCEISPAGIE